jgi:uncharacterized protein YbcC (UPF0753/DUF2309 family)
VDGKGIVKKYALTEDIINVIVDNHSNKTVFKKSSLRKREISELADMISSIEKRAAKDNKVFTKTIQEIVRLTLEEIKSQTTVTKAIEKEVSKLVCRQILDHFISRWVGVFSCWHHPTRQRTPCMR